MALIYMVRHGRAAAGWDTAVDPSLDNLGREQSELLAKRLQEVGPIPIVSSPLARCRETAMPLASLWGVEVRVEPRVAEIPSPPDHTMDTRLDWLRMAMKGTWSDLGADYMTYRKSVRDCISTMLENAVVFSHFVAINAVLGSVLGDDRVLIDSLDNCSVTVFETDGKGGLKVIQRGHQADTLIR